MIKYIRRLLLPLLLLFSMPAMACTIFVLTDGEHTYFFNNEDYSDPNTRIWFRPGGESYYGAVFVGFDNGWAQGGLNTAGLAYDWYAGGEVPYRLPDHLKIAKQNPCERLLESCATVEEAIEFFKTYAEPGFAYATILIADKTGASVIIGARNGELFFERSNSNAAIGYGLQTFEKLNGRNAEANLTDGTEILHQCEQKGNFATKYSSIYNLQSGAISIYQFHSDTESVDFTLEEELEKGAHYFDLPQIKTQLSEPLMPLSLNQQRLPLYDFEDISHTAPEITDRVRAVIQNSINGTINKDHYDQEFWKKIKPELNNIRKEQAKLGAFLSVHLISQKELEGVAVYNYVIIYENLRVLMGLHFGQDMKIQNIESHVSDLTNIEILNEIEISRTQKGGSNYFSWIILATLGLLLIYVYLKKFTSKPYQFST